MNNTGSENPNAKLNEADAYVARRLIERGYTTRSVAWMFDVKPNTIRCLVIRKTWRHVK